MKTIYIGVNVDWSKSFVDKNGGFYCGTTEEQKQVAAELMPHLDLTVNTTDFHSVKSKEFKKNGGMWPFHNVAEFRTINVRDLGLPENTTISPEQTEVIENRINKVRSGVIVPKHVYFQDGNEPAFTPELVEEAFGQRIIKPNEFLKDDFTYIISPKTHFDGTAIVSDYNLPRSVPERVPEQEYTVFDLIETKYPKDKFNVVYVGTGVVDNICRHYTTTGLRQKYGRRVVNIIGATTELYGIGLGFEDKKQVRDASERIQRDIGIEHKTLDEMLEEIRSSR